MGESLRDCLYQAEKQDNEPDVPDLTQKTGNSSELTVHPVTAQNDYYKAKTMLEAIGIITK